MNRDEFYTSLEENSLQHHGIKGQKWGVRRYQSLDGSLTVAGRERYYKKTTDVNEILSNKVQKDMDTKFLSRGDSGAYGTARESELEFEGMTADQLKNHLTSDTTKNIEKSFESGKPLTKQEFSKEVDASAQYYSKISKISVDRSIVLGERAKKLNMAAVGGVALAAVGAAAAVGGIYVAPMLIEIGALHAVGLAIAGNKVEKHSADRLGDAMEYAAVAKDLRSKQVDAMYKEYLKDLKNNK